eukprot:GHVP01061914.1.p2 GENE.GHVP01061914.1~~GHVP01061914.1.p2  ORF type:complete len:189 (+),score=34.23 GHVP01061914.1:1785-2351(+)
MEFRSDVNNQEVDPQAPPEHHVMLGWLRRARRRFRKGVQVIKITAHGKLVKRTVTYGAKYECLEISSAKLFDVVYHIGEIFYVKEGAESPEFDKFRVEQPERVPKDGKSAVLGTENKTISLVFRDESERRDFVWLLRCECAIFEDKYPGLKQNMAENAGVALNCEPEAPEGSQIDVSPPDTPVSLQNI